MNSKQLFTKMLLVALCLIGGSGFAWADVTPFSQDYESTAEPDWTSSITSRYTTALAESSGNHYVQVSAVSSGDSGALIKSNSTNGKAAAGNNYTLIFDLKISGGNNQASWFQVNDANNTDANVNSSADATKCMLLLQQTAAGSASWKINGSENQTVTLSRTDWNRIKLTVYNGKTYLTVIDISSSNNVFARTLITTNSSTGGLGGMQFATKRYYSAMSIDNVVVREVEDGDVPLYTATFTESNNLTPVVNIYSDSERTNSVTNGQLEDATTYYYTASLENYYDNQGSFTVNGENPSIDFTMTNTYTYNVYAVDNEGTKLQEDAIATASGSIEDEAKTIVWSKYIKIADQWYVTSETTFSINVSESGTRNVVYNTASNITDFYEMEKLSRSGGKSLTESSINYSNGLRLRLSNGSTYYTPALTGGIYQLTITCVNSNNTSNEVYVRTRSSEGVLSEVLYTHTATNGTTTLSTSITVPDGHSIAFNGNEGSYNNNARMDYMTLNRDYIAEAIADCKTYETSAEFATALAAQSFATAAEVYAFHSSWQIAKAQANGSTDYSKAIMNRTFELHNTNGWTITGDAATNAPSDDDKYGKVEYDDDWSQYYTGWNGRNVSQNIASLPAGVYRLSATVYSNGATVKLFANGNLSDDIVVSDTESPTFDFTVTGNEPIKIGIGGTGQGEGDNTWGKWYYRVKNFTLTKIANVSKNITSAGWATYCSPYALDFSEVEGLTAYIVTGGANGKLTTTEVTSVPAGTGVLLKGAAGDYTIPVAASSATDVTGNKLTGVTTATPIDANAGYVLMNGNEGVAFYKNANAFTVGANTAYLPANFATNTARAFFSFGDDATDIRLIENGKIENSVYDLQGRRVSQPAKGLYIKDGKVVVVK